MAQVFHDIGSTVNTLWRLILWLILGAGTNWCGATQINWRSPIAATNVLSDGSTAMGSGFEFQLGAFAGGFVPAADNTGEWAAHWRALDTTPYNATTRFFSDSVLLQSNSAPFAAGTSGYLWGRAPAGADGTSQWILMRSVRWRWPVASEGVAFPVEWEVDEAAVAVLGEVNGPGFVMKSAAVVNGAADAAQAWLENTFSAAQLADPAISGWDADPDADGVHNLLEFATGGAPLHADAHVAAPRWTRASTGGHVLSMPVTEAAQGRITFKLQFSVRLNAWTALPARPELEDGRITFRVNSGTEALYYRIIATLD